MKTLFIEAKYNKKIILPKSLLDILPHKVALFSAIQFIASYNSIKKQIESIGKTVLVVKTRHTKYPGQILGCNIEKFNGIDAFLYIGDGLFHPYSLLQKNELPVYIFNPFTRDVKIISTDEISSYRNRQKAAYKKFLISGKIGVLISLKHGQNRYKEALTLKTKYANKKFYYIIGDTIEYQNLEDFNFIECFVNTACPRIGIEDNFLYSKPMVNLDDVI